MTLQDRKSLRSTAKERLENAAGAVKIALIYAAIIVGASIITNLIQFFLDQQISQAGGLSNLEFRTMLTSIQTIVPPILNLLLMAVGLGFTGAMLRISRGQYASPRSMKIGFDRFWVLLRAQLLQAGLYLAAAIGSSMIASVALFMLPMPKGLIESASSVLGGTGADPMALLADPGFLSQLMKLAIPMYVIMGLLFLAAALVIHYHYRLVNYILIEKPGTGALLAMQQSRTLMRGNCIPFFKLDLSLWWYYAAELLSVLVCYGASFLILLGVEIPISPMALTLLFFGIYLLMVFLITLFLQPLVEVTHALAYDTLKPKEEPGGGVVLGNIFNM